jgi:hypothetical protein
MRFRFLVLGAVMAGRADRREARRGCHRGARRRRSRDRQRALATRSATRRKAKLLERSRAWRLKQCGANLASGACTTSTYRRKGRRTPPAALGGRPQGVDGSYAALAAARSTSRIRMIAEGGAINSCFFVVTPTTRQPSAPSSLSCASMSRPVSMTLYSKRFTVTPPFQWNCCLIA